MPALITAFEAKTPAASFHVHFPTIFAPPNSLTMNQKDKSGKRPRIVKVTVKKASEKRPPKTEGYSRPGTDRPYADRDGRPAEKRRDDKPSYGDRNDQKKSYNKAGAEKASGARSGDYKPAKGAYRDKTEYSDKAATGKTYRKAGADSGATRAEDMGSGGGGSRVKSSYGDRPAHKKTYTKAESYKPKGSGKAEQGSDAGAYHEKPAYGDKPAPRKTYGKAVGGKATRTGSADHGPEKRSYSDKPAKGGYRSKERDEHDRPKAGGSRKTYPARNERPGRPSSAEKRGSGERKGGADGLIRLNKYLADAGVCSRREADDLIKAGVVTVNGKIVNEVGTKVRPEDKVIYGGQTLSREKLRYVLLNKPKGYITTSDDPFDRKTVMELVKDACSERIYPVGRLDRNTLGLLLFTNDGELAKKLMHPRFGVKKLYHVELDKPLTKADLLKIAEGVELEDGLAEVDKIAWVEKVESKNEVGIELHSGKNRIVRRIFEHMGYKVVKLDRVIFGGLTKLNLNRGRHRHLTPKEIAMLKMIK